MNGLYSYLLLIKMMLLTSILSISLQHLDDFSSFSPILNCVCMSTHRLQESWTFGVCCTGMHDQMRKWWGNRWCKNRNVRDSHVKKLLGGQISFHGKNESKCYKRFWGLLKIMSEERYRTLGIAPWHTMMASWYKKLPPLQDWIITRAMAACNRPIYM